MADKELKLLQTEIKKLIKKVDNLEDKLSKHIVFIEHLYKRVLINLRGFLNNG